MLNNIIKRNINIAFNLFSRSSIIKRNPGIGAQIAEIEDAADAIKSDPEGFGDLESNFANAHKSHRQHQLEMQIQRDHIRYLIVKNKYFKDPRLPNMLTYGEKEHIRMLYNKDPETWTFEHLAESFPATTDIIQKIVKSKWIPSSVERLRSHDKHVFKNWQRFKNGDFDDQLPSELKMHLMKFLDRRLEDLKSLPDPAESFTPIELPKPKVRYFQNLLTSSSSSNEEQDEVKISSENKHFIELTDVEQNRPTLTKNEEESETYLLGKVHDKRIMTIKELKDLKLPKILHLESGNDKCNYKADSSIEENLRTTSATGIIRREKSDMLKFTEKFSSNEIVISSEDQKRYEMSTIKNRVRIPRKLWRKGATYRVEDCYYDDDGEFLYRVPGMTFV